MKTVNLTKLSVSELADLFLQVAIAQFEAQRRRQIAKYNRLFDKMAAVEKELERRPGDQRIALVPLLQHRNEQVRLMAAHATMQVARDEAYAAFKVLSEENRFPQTANAGFALRKLEGQKWPPE